MRQHIVILWALMLATEIACVAFEVPVSQGMRYSNLAAYIAGLAMALELWKLK